MYSVETITLVQPAPITPSVEARLEAAKRDENMIVRIIPWNHLSSVKENTQNLFPVVVFFNRAQPFMGDGSTVDYTFINRADYNKLTGSELPELPETITKATFAFDIPNSLARKYHAQYPDQIWIDGTTVVTSKEGLLALITLEIGADY